MTAPCAVQGVPVKVTDVTVVRRVGVLLGGQAGASRAQARSASTRGADDDLQPPHDVDPVPVDAAGTWLTRADADVVDQRCGDGVLARQIQARPRSA